MAEPSDGAAWAAGCRPCWARPTRRSGRAAAASAPAGGPQQTPIELLRRNPDQPRKAFGDAELGDLTDSIRDKGVLQPILVRPAPGAPGEYQIVAGERRWRAAQRAGLRTVPVLVRELDDLEVLEIAIIENVQRADLNPMEEAQGYKALIDRFGRTQEAVAKAVGKSRSHVANALRLLALPEEVRDHLVGGPTDRRPRPRHRHRARSVRPGAHHRGRDLSVREAEALAAATASGRRAPPVRPDRGGRAARTPTPARWSRTCREVLGLHGRDRRPRTARGELRIRYQTLEQLDELCGKLSR